jgi:dTDP-glucose 4,6-dehydratase
MGRHFQEVTKMVAERPGQDAAYVIDSSLARSEFGWKPLISLREGVEEVVDWVSMNWPEISQQSLVYEHKL